MPSYENTIGFEIEKHLQLGVRSVIMSDEKRKAGKLMLVGWWAFIILLGSGFTIQAAWIAAAVIYYGLAMGWFD